MNGEYNEKLKSGGELVVSLYEWKIQYYFSGPDLRYNGTFIKIYGAEIDEYIDAWKSNFETYSSLKRKIAHGASFITIGKKKMPIRIGNFSGVYLSGFCLPIKTSKELDRLIEDYKYAKQHATQIQKFLKTL